jgi:rhodanese-related sulfurtransferase
MTLPTANIENRAGGDSSMPTKNPQEPFHRLTVEEAKQLLAQGAHIIDVREPHEYQAGHIPGAPLIPVNSVFARREELPKAAGLPPERLYNLEGGTEGWIKAGEPVEQ